MKIKGSAQIWAVNNSGVLTDYRKMDNLIFDVSRPYFFFNSNTEMPSPVLNVSGVYVYLSDQVCVNQSSYEAILESTYYTEAADARGVVVSATYGEVSFMEQEYIIFSTATFASANDNNIINSLGIGFRVGHTDPTYHYHYTPITCTNVIPPIPQPIGITVFVHYILEVSITDEYMFGIDVLRRVPSMALSYFGSGTDCNYYVGIPFYKKQFYVANLTAYAPSYGGYIFPTHDHSLVTPFEEIPNIRSQYKWGSFVIPQASVGPYGGAYEGRNSSLGVACISEPHVSRIFQHIESESSLLFYDPSETDVPEGDGTISIDLSSVDLDDPTAYKIRIISSGEVGEAEYKVVRYLGTSSNTLGLGALYRSIHSSNDFSHRIFHMYVSQNREWSAHRLSISYFRGDGYDIYPLTYLYIRYKEGVRFVLNRIYDNYAIKDDGICYVSYAASPTTIYTIDGSDEKPGYVTETYLFDLVAGFPSQGITEIRGLTIDEDLGYLWVATNNCFVRINFAGSSAEIFDHNTLSFGEYCTADSVVLYDPFNGRFQAEDGTLTWVPNNLPGSVFHWTGDRSARVCASGSNFVLNLMQDLTLGYICIMRCAVDALGSPLGSQMYPQVLRIGGATEGVVITYSSSLPVGYLFEYEYGNYNYPCPNGEAFSMCVDNGFFLFASPAPTRPPGVSDLAPYAVYDPTNGRGMKGCIDLTTFIETRGACIGQPFYSLGKQTPNRSLVEGCISISLEYAQWVVLSLGQEYGWDGASWVVGESAGKLTHADSQELPGGVGISFVDSFLSGEYYSFGVNPQGLYKDNLEDITMYGCYYSGKAVVEERTIIVPSGHIYSIPEKTDPDFLCMNGWKYCSHSRALLVDFGDSPLELVDVPPISSNQVQFTDEGDIVFYTAGLRVKVRYVWVSKG